MSAQPSLFTEPQEAMPADSEGAQDGLFRPSYGAGDTERDAVEAVNALHTARPFTPAQKLAARVILSLAANIDRGNMKGRAVGNEAMQLMAALESLAGTADPTDPTDPSDLPADTAALMAAMGQAPTAPGGVSAWTP